MILASRASEAGERMSHAAVFEEHWLGSDLSSQMKTRNPLLPRLTCAIAEAIAALAKK